MEINPILYERKCIDNNLPRSEINYRQLYEDSGIEKTHYKSSFKPTVERSTLEVALLFQNVPEIELNPVINYLIATGIFETNQGEFYKPCDYGIKRAFEIESGEFKI